MACNNEAMERAIGAMTNMAATLAQQAEQAKQRDIQTHLRMDRAANNKGLFDFKKHDLSQFNGELDPKKTNLWIQELKKIFLALHCIDEVKVPYATYLLIGDTEYWWNGNTAATGGEIPGNHMHSISHKVFSEVLSTKC